MQARGSSDTQNFQAGTYVNWTLSNGTAAPAVNTIHAPLQFSVNLQDQIAPTFLSGPTFTPQPVSLHYLALEPHWTTCWAHTCDATAHTLYNMGHSQ